MDKTLIKKLVAICGKENVLHHRSDLFLYEYDASMERGRPDVIVFPETVEQIQEIVKLASLFKCAYIARGAATNLCGGTIASEGGIVIEMAKLDRIIELDFDNQVAVVEPGVVNLVLQNALAAHGYSFAPDPASQKVSTLGGNVAMNAGGPHCLKYGVTVNHVLGLEIISPDGQKVQFGGKTEGMPGYDILGLLNGSEGTLGIITKLFLRILPQPESQTTLLIAFPSIESAANAVSTIIARGIIPATLEYMDRVCIKTVVDSLNVDYPLDAAAVLIVELDGSKQTSARCSDVINRICMDEGATEVRHAKDDMERASLWSGRRGALGAMTRLKPSVVVFDGTVPRNRLPEALKSIENICRRHRLFYGTLLHAGDGNIHPIIVYNEKDSDETARVREGCEKIMRLCVDLGGTITGEHGVGTEKLSAMPYLFTEKDLETMRRVKNIFDPGNLCNPGKVIPGMRTTSSA